MLSDHILARQRCRDLCAYENLLVPTSSVLPENVCVEANDNRVPPFKNK